MSGIDGYIEEYEAKIFLMNGEKQKEKLEKHSVSLRVRSWFQQEANRGYTKESRINSPP